MQEVLLGRAKSLRKEIYSVDSEIKERLPQKVSTDKLEDIIGYCQDLVNVVESTPKISVYAKVKQRLNYLKEAIGDGLEQLSISKDEDSRVGHKTSDSFFFGYKTHIAMSEERIITGAVVTTGEKTDGKELQGKKQTKRNQYTTYFFDVNKCRCCSLRDGCYKDGSKSKTYSVSMKCDIHKNQMIFQETEYFKEQSRKRYMIEAKNSELKHQHGYDVALSSGLINMQMQGALTVFTVKMKRIIKLIAK